MKISVRDRDILRRLAGEQAAIAALPVHAEKAELWRKLNDLDSRRPMVWINEICWNEMDFEHELTLQCESPLGRRVEDELRKQLYQWRHLPVDMIVEPVFYSYLFIEDSGFGIQNTENRISQAAGDICSHGYLPQIKQEADVEKIKDPVLTLDREATEDCFSQLDAIFGDLLQVKTGGIARAWFSPWDQLVQWYGVQEALLDLCLRPELIHMCMDRLVNAFLARLRQWEELNVLIVPPGNYRVGSGGLGYTDDLPRPDSGKPVSTCHQWGCAAAQIFSEVGPEMHQEFALNYERRWLERFGLTYYGCCEPLHNKFEILKTIPNLRKISASPWCKLDKLFQQTGDRYVISYKPSPAIFATDEWSPESAEKTLRRDLDLLRGAHVEIILKDLSTLRGQPQRLWEWAAMARRVSEEYAR